MCLRMGTTLRWIPPDVGSVSGGLYTVRETVNGAGVSKRACSGIKPPSGVNCAGGGNKLCE